MMTSANFSSARKFDDSDNLLPGYTFLYGYNAAGNQQFHRRQTPPFRLRRQLPQPRPTTNRPHCPLHTRPNRRRSRCQRQRTNRSTIRQILRRRSSRRSQYPTRFPQYPHHATKSRQIIQETGDLLVPANQKTFQHDTNGNLLQDGQWQYT